ncbi:MAG: electron transfer flavoprotein beta subunit [Myxococcota bacterium]|jgi:electron transfer flavoprotein beta subunit
MPPSGREPDPCGTAAIHDQESLVNIGVCVKIAPDTNARVKFASDGSGFDMGDQVHGIPDYDEYAVEEAMRAKETHEGTVTVFTVGGNSAEKYLRKGVLALDGDKAVVIDADPSDAIEVAQLLAKAVQAEGCEIVFTGKSSTDGGSHQLSPMLAECLGWALVSKVVELSIDGDTFTATRAMDAGIKQVVRGKLPAVITCEDGLNKVRLPNMRGIMKAKRKPIETRTAAELGVTVGGARTTNAAFRAPPSRPAGRIIEGDAATAAKELVRLLREEAKVI